MRTPRPCGSGRLRLHGWRFPLTGRGGQPRLAVVHRVRGGFGACQEERHESCRGASAARARQDPAGPGSFGVAYAGNSPGSSPRTSAGGCGADATERCTGGASNAGARRGARERRAGESHGRGRRARVALRTPEHAVPRNEPGRRRGARRRASDGRGLARSRRPGGPGPALGDVTYIQDAPDRCALCGRPLDPEAGPEGPRRGSVPWSWARTSCHGSVHVDCLRKERSDCAERERRRRGPGW